MRFEYQMLQDELEERLAKRILEKDKYVTHESMERQVNQAIEEIAGMLVELREKRGERT